MANIRFDYSKAAEFINEDEIKEQAKQMFIEDCEKHGIELIDDIQ